MKRSTIVIAIIALSAIIALNWGTHPRLTAADDSSFSTERIAEDIRKISEKPHSITDGKERAEVRDYLQRRLKELGGETKVFTYDSLQGAGFRFDAHNVYATFEPDGHKADSYLMMIAHYDSRYRWILAGDTAVSHGAADDGYGIGVILETLRLASMYRNEWKQGIKVLFTDGEEVGMIGMKAAYAHNREIFDNVGLALNVESRGMYGPVLLFETSPKNDRLIELYADNARYPHTYSLTNVVYKYMPNSPDLAIIMDSVPGLNFATIADINHYHTSLDRYENISLPTIEHYGRQIIPIVGHYLTGTRYSDSRYLAGSEEITNFTIPVLGLFKFSKGGYNILNVLFVLIFLILLIKDFKQLCSSARTSIATLLAVPAAMAFATALGTLATWICSETAGIRFSFMGIMAGIPYDNKAMLACLLIIAAATILLSAKWIKGNSTQRHAALLHATLLLQGIGSIALLATLGENMILFVPFAVTVAAVALWKIKQWSIFPLAAIAVISLHAFSFLYTVAMALTIGALGAIALLAFNYSLNIALLATMASKKTGH